MWRLALKCRYFPGTCRVFSVDTSRREKPVILTGDIVFKLYHIHSFGQLGTQYIELVRLIFHTGMEFHAQKNSFVDEDRCVSKTHNTGRVQTFTSNGVIEAEDGGSEGEPVDIKINISDTDCKDYKDQMAQILHENVEDKSEDKSLPIVNLKTEVRDSVWGSNLQETDLVLEGKTRPQSVSAPTSSVLPKEYNREGRAESEGKQRSKSAPIVYTFPLCDLDEAYKDAR